MTRLRQVGKAVTELIAPEAPGVADATVSDTSTASIKRDWTARPRGNILSALRYTQFVAFMKRLLPITAGAVVAAVVAFFFFQRAPERMVLSYESTGRIDNDLAMIKPQLKGTDDAGNPFVITADAAIQDSRSARRARLEKVEADIQTGNERWLSATAARGMYDMDAGTLVLRDGISFYSDDGYELHTRQADVDLKSDVMTGPEVTGQGPMGTLRADNFKVNRVSRQLELKGNVRMTLISK